MKITPELLSILVEQGDAISVRGRWYLAVDRIDQKRDLELADKLPEPLPFDAEADLTRGGARDKQEPKRGR